MPLGSRHLSVTIDCPAAVAYAWLSVPENFPQWAAGLATSLREEGGEWIAESPVGPMRIVFSPPNDYGVLDHRVYPAEGGEVYVPLRIIPNGEGCELVLTLFRQPGMDDAKYDQDAALVMRDLEFARKLLEYGPGRRK